MIADTLRRLAEGVISPRSSARWILSGHHDARTAVLFTVLGYLIVAMFSIVMAPLMPEHPAADINPLIGHLADLTLRVVSVFVQGLIVFGVGRVFGGTGSRRQSFVIIAWHSLVTSFLAPLIMLGGAQVQAEPSGSAILVVIAGLAYTWLLAVYVTELHGFRSVGLVLAAILAISAAIGGLLLSAARAAGAVMVSSGF